MHAESGRQENTSKKGSVEGLQQCAMWCKSVLMNDECVLRSRIDEVK